MTVNVYGSCSKHGRRAKRIQNICRKTRREKAIWNITHKCKDNIKMVIGHEHVDLIHRA